jgi:hypothetical protein
MRNNSPCGDVANLYIQAFKQRTARQRAYFTLLAKQPCRRIVAPLEYTLRANNLAHFQRAFPEVKLGPDGLSNPFTLPTEPERRTGYAVIAENGKIAVLLPREIGEKMEISDAHILGGRH